MKNFFTIVLLSCLSTIVLGQSLSSITPNNATSNQTLNVTIVGQNTSFDQGSITVDFVGPVYQGSPTIFSGYNIVPTDSENVSMDITIPFQINGLSSTGSYDVVYNNPGQGITNVTLSNGFTVNGPQLMSASPDTLFSGQMATVTIVGQNVDFTQGSITGVHVLSGLSLMGTNTTVINATTLTTDIFIPGGAASGAKTIMLDHGVYGDMLLNNAIYIQDPNLVSMSPDQTFPGQTLSVSIVGQGMNFTQSTNTSVYLQSDFTVQGSQTTLQGVNLNPINPTTLSADFTIPFSYAGDPSYGTYTLYLVNHDLGASYTLAAALNVLQPGLISISPDTGMQGESLVVTVVGANIDFNMGSSTTVYMEAAGRDTIQATSVSVVDAITVNALFDFADTALVDQYNVHTVNSYGDLQHASPFNLIADTSLALAVQTTITNVSCAGYLDGSIVSSVVGGDTPYSYLWSTGATTDALNAMGAGFFSLTVTDNNGDIAVDSNLVITEPGTITLSIASQNALCNGSNDGVVSVTVSGGTAPYDILLNGDSVGTVSAGLMANIYAIDVMDANMCLSTDTVVILEPAKITASTTVTLATCGVADGLVDLAVTGGTTPYNYNWSNTSTGDTLANVGAGNYQVTITDGNGCSLKEIVAVGDTDGPTVTISTIVDANCGGADGEMYITVTGGTAPYTYMWSNGNTTASLLDAAAGTNTVVVTGVNGCSGAATAVIGTQGTVAPSLQGTVRDSVNGIPVTAGMVYVLAPNPYQAAMDVVAQTSINGDGSYNITSVLPIGNYLIKAVADTTVTPFAGTIPTYYEYSVKWNEALSVSAVCDTVIEVDLAVINLNPLTGTNVISGYVASDGDGNRFGRAGDPIPGIDVALEQIPGGIIAFTETDSSGVFTFNNVPSSDSLFKIHIDIPGLDLVQTYTVDLSTAEVDTTVSDLNFLVSDSTIYIDESSSIIEINPNNQLKAFPNPYKGKTTLQIAMVGDDQVNIEVYNIVGELVYQKNESNINTNNYRFEFDSSNLNSQFYIVKATVGSQTHITRIIDMK